MTIKQFPIDYFGVVLAPHVRGLMDQSSSNGKRKASLRRIIKVVEASIFPEILPKADLAGLMVDTSGQIKLVFLSDDTDLEFTSNGN